MLRIKSMITPVPQTGGVLSTLVIEPEETTPPQEGSAEAAPHPVHWLSSVHYARPVMTKIQTDEKDGARQHELCLKWCLLSAFQQQLATLRVARQSPSA